MDDLILRKGQPYGVDTGTSSGLNLRRKPTTNDKTEDGKNNLIFSLPNHSIVWLESEKSEKSDGHIWYHVRYTDVVVGIDEPGWVASKYLYPTGLGGTPPTYTFTFREKNPKYVKGKNKEFIDKKYSISQVNLVSAKGLYIFEAPPTNSKSEDKIPRDKITIIGKDFWTSSQNIESMKALHWI